MKHLCRHLACGSKFGRDAEDVKSKRSCVDLKPTVLTVPNAVYLLQGSLHCEVEDAPEDIGLEHLQLAPLTLPKPKAHTSKRNG